MKPTKLKDQVRQGDLCSSRTGDIGEVLRIVKTRSIPYAVVKWGNGSIGRHTITTLVLYCRGCGS